jgi:hypothetical protein
LSDEHIIAFSLGANVYMPNASCAGCAKITSYLEGYAARAIYGPFRIFFGVQSRRKKIDLGDVPVVFTTERGKETRQIPRVQLPPLFSVPLLSPAGIFEHKEPEPIIPATGWIWFASDPKEYMKRFRQEGDRTWEFRGNINTIVFARVLAKISHTITTALVGVDGFEPLLPPLILGKTDKAAYLIGCADAPTPAERPPSGPSMVHHDIAVSAMAENGQRPLLVTKIRLFSFTGAPSYYVVAGIPKRPALERLGVDGELQVL